MAQLILYLDAEHAGTPCADNPRPLRHAHAQYDVIEHDGNRYYMESTIDLVTGEEVDKRRLHPKQRASFTVDEFQEFIDNALTGPVFQLSWRRWNFHLAGRWLLTPGHMAARTLETTTPLASRSSSALLET
ncbi:copper amine oxidase 1 [Metarhizium guizhouense ARSEF 977]|uniref:Copper amine oxidase 1 n=1 Tax=Metarhizium guizhouense (strain ARSEF 977) TaxID=1276136 RepID=A0A0B4GE13_METGA|nr:copper amine oxidase 1 [Metarhizium guizhouense ARSEF 977]